MRDHIKEYFDEVKSKVIKNWEECIEEESGKKEELLFRSWVISKLAQLEMMLDLVAYKFIEKDEEK